MKLTLTFAALAFTVMVFSQNAASGAIHKPRLKRSGLSPEKSFGLDKAIPEGSGLAVWNGLLWTHNDSGKPSLFALDTTSGKIAARYELPGVKNTDWEEIDQDSAYFYIGDFGNNIGKRDTLQIIRVQKSSLLRNDPMIDRIRFSWPETVTKGETQKINFNCEAMVVIKDSIYLFTKEQKSGRQSRVFSLPAKPGDYEARYHSALKTNLLITGASYLENQRKLVLCGYNLKLRPFLLVFTNVDETGFFSTEARKIRIRKRFRQIEGVTSFDGKRYFLINEDFNAWFLHTKQQLHVVDLPK